MIDAVYRLFAVVSIRAPTFAPQILRTLPRIPPMFACPARAAVVDGCNPHATFRKAIAPSRVS